MVSSPDYYEVYIFSSFSEKGQTLIQAHIDENLKKIKTKMLGVIISGTGVLSTIRVQQAVNVLQSGFPLYKSSHFCGA